MSIGPRKIIPREGHFFELEIVDTLHKIIRNGGVTIRILISEVKNSIKVSPNEPRGSDIPADHVQCILKITSGVGIAGCIHIRESEGYDITMTRHGNHLRKSSTMLQEREAFKKHQIIKGSLPRYQWG